MGTIARVKRGWLRAVMVVLAMTVAGPAAAHHGWGSYDADRPLTLTGPIRVVSFENPHVQLTLETPGKVWEVILAPISRMLNRGARADLLEVGKTISVIPAGCTRASCAPSGSPSTVKRSSCADRSGEMPADLWLALETSALGQAMRLSPFLYPAANVLHVLALMVFFAAVAAMDARLLGAGHSLPLSAVISACRPSAAAALVVQAASGLCLFAAEATALVTNDVFRLKLMVIALGLANVAVLEGCYGTRLRDQPAGQSLPAGARAIAAVSLVGWLTTAALGGLIGYF
jgi:hypothetical protein